MSDKYSQFDLLLSLDPSARPRALFSAKLRAKLFVHAFSTELGSGLIARSLSFASAGMATVLVVITSAFVRGNPEVNAASALYPLKRTIEGIELSLTARTPADEANAHLRLASLRGDELRVLRSQVGEGSVSRTAFEETLQAVVGSTSHAAGAAKRSENVEVQGRISRAAAQEAKALMSFQETLVAAENISNTALEAISEVVSDSDVGSSDTALIHEAAEALEDIAQSSAGDDATIVPFKTVPVARD